MLQPYENAYQLCIQKTRINIERLAEVEKSCALAVDGNYFEFWEGFYEIGNWTSSFFTGMALLAYETSGERYFLKQVHRLSERYSKKVFERQRDTMHDLGFLYSLYAVALYKLTGDPNSRTIAIKAADELAKRFVVPGGYIRAWGRMDDRSSDYAGLAIIDCMMNLPLLFWASEQTGNSFYHDIAVKHADTTMRYFVRADDSVCHAYRFDLETGEPDREDSYCGYDVGSHWARGTTWAMYGFALAHRYTQDRRYIETSRKLAQKYIINLDDRVVPIWDFALPDNMPPLRDSSAAAVAVCGLQELLRAYPGEQSFAECADATLSMLCSDIYLHADPLCCGVLKDGQVGHPDTRAQNAYTSWGDYFLMEALAKRLYGVAGYW